ncbi:unnamed protein product [Brassica oleracea]
MRCMALLPRSDHATLSRVSKRYRSLVASPELYEIRSQLGYSCFYLMTPIHPCPSSHPMEGFSVVSLDRGIYVIGGSRNREHSSSCVLLLDCRTHTWRQVTSMKVARCNPAAGVVDGKIYVLEELQPA